MITLISKDLEIAVLFPENRAFKKAIITPHPQTKLVEDISLHFHMRPIGKQGVVFNRVEQKSDGDRIYFDHGKAMLDPPLQYGEVFSYSASFNGAFDQQAGIIIWPIRHQTDHIEFIFDTGDSTLNWFAEYLPHHHRMGNGETLHYLTDGSVVVFEYDDPNIGSRLLFKWEKPTHLLPLVV